MWARNSCMKQFKGTVMKRDLLFFYFTKIYRTFSSFYPESIHVEISRMECFIFSHFLRISQNVSAFETFIFLLSKELERRCCRMRIDHLGGFLKFYLQPILIHSLLGYQKVCKWVNLISSWGGGVPVEISSKSNFQIISVKFSTIGI